MALTEADTCQRFVTPALESAGWDKFTQIARERKVTDGRIIVVGTQTKRKPPLFADYVLRYTSDLPIAIVEAKAYDLPAEDGVQQAINYCQMLGLRFAYATNGKEIIEHDLKLGTEVRVTKFPSPDDLWERICDEIDLKEREREIILTPGFIDPVREPRYYQTRAINSAISTIAEGKDRALLTLATGTGKSFIAFQICFKLWSARWNRKGTHHRPKILYLADRNVLVQQPKNGVFAPFGDALHIISKKAVKSREMYFSTYQMLAEDEARPGLYREYEPDFFDLIVVDECHRGSSKEDSNWREILEYFSGSAKIGMTATPLREDSRDTYEYFGNPIMQYSLSQGIEDGFLAPYKVRRVVTDIDATGWRPNINEKDRFGNEIPDAQYGTPDFQRLIVLTERTKAFARYLTSHLHKTDRFAKTIIFCVDQEHASSMRQELISLNTDLVSKHPDYICRVTADEKNVGRGHLDRFQDVDSKTPVILTTSEMLTTGVDAPTVQNIVIGRVVNSMSTFKQIIGRGTRLREDYGKLYFTIIDFTGSATQKFADSEFDGFPEDLIEERVDANGEIVDIENANRTEDGPEPIREAIDPLEELRDSEIESTPTRKFYVDNVTVQITAETVLELDSSGNQLRTISLTDYTGERVRALFRSSTELAAKWVEPKFRKEIIKDLELRGIDINQIAKETERIDLDAFDLLCHLAFNAPTKSRKQRSLHVRSKRDFWSTYSPLARDVLKALLDKYDEYGSVEFDFPAILEVPPISAIGNVSEIVAAFGGTKAARKAFADLQKHIYAA